MNKRQIMSKIAEVFGFNAKKIVLLEYGSDCFGEVEFARFEVCGVVYETDFEYLELLEQ